MRDYVERTCGTILPGPRWSSFTEKQKIERLRNVIEDQAHAIQALKRNVQFLMEDHAFRAGRESRKNSEGG